MKRFFDILLSFIGLVILSPILIILSIIIKLSSPGPILYRGIREGRNRNSFKINKFRSMVVNAEKLGPSSTSDTDTRITPIGKFMRRLKLDELPQLINVLKGEMSFVGPRPQVLDIAKDVDDIVFSVRPGITDWASLKFHNEGEIILASGMTDADEAYMQLIHPEKTRLQIAYVNNQSFWVDIKIIGQTVAAIIYTRTKKGA